MCHRDPRGMMQEWWCDKAKCPLHAAAGAVTYGEWFGWLTITTATAVKAAVSCHSQHQVTWRDHVTRSESDTSYLRLHTWAAEDNGDVNRWRSCQCHRTCLPDSAINYSVVHPWLIFIFSLHNALFYQNYVRAFVQLSLLVVLVNCTNIGLLLLL